MKRLKITIEFEIKGDLDDMDTLKDDVIDRVMSDIDEDELEFSIEDLDEEEEDYE